MGLFEQIYEILPFGYCIGSLSATEETNMKIQNSILLRSLAGAGEMAPQLQALATTPDDLDLISRDDIASEKN